MKVSALLLASIFCQGHAYLEGSPDSRGVDFGFAPRQEPQCPPVGIHHLPDPSHCNRYYKCIKGRVGYYICPEGLVYNRATPPDGDPCDDPANTTCYILLPPTPPSPPPPACPGGGQRHLPDPEDCSAFYECRRGAAYPRKCPDELLYNVFSPPTRYPCDYPDNVDCGAAYPPPPPPPPPPPQDPGQDKATKGFHFYKGVNIP